MKINLRKDLSSISDDLSKRGLIKDRTFEDLTWLDAPGRKFYLGIDASSDSLTIGNLAVILLARRLVEAGWQAVLLAGGATSLVGDPGGKDEERELKSREEIENNIKSVQSQIEKLFGGLPHEMVNNIDWLGGLNYLDFLREVGKHFSMTELTQREFVTARIGGTGISYAEFSYSILQGYDFWWLFKNKDVQMQIGASDQWGNMLSGVPLIRKKEGKEAHAFSMPLVINKETGVKFGKSEAGAVWLDPERTSPTQFYQFWINVSDAEVGDFLKIYTMLPLERIQEIMEYHVSSPEERKAQASLARGVTVLVHGEEEARKAQTVTEVLTGQTSVGEVGEEVLDEVRKEIPSLPAKPGDDIAEVLVNAGLVSSKREGREIRAGGGVYINNQGFTGEQLQDEHFLNGRLLLRRGKAFKDSALIEIK